MGHRYRISVDICEEDVGNVTSDILKEAAEAAVSAVKLVLTPELKRFIKVEPVQQQYHLPWHAHTGNSSCSGCMHAANDGKGGDVSELFPARPTV